MAVDVHVRGHIFTFSWYHFVRAFVDITVLLHIPNMVVQFIAMYLMGVSSEVYRHTARTKLNIISKIHNSIAKLMLAEVAFRGMVSDFSSCIEDLPSLRPSMLLGRLQDVFLDEFNVGELQVDELQKMTCVAFMSMDKDQSGKVGCREFIEACTNDGEITMQRMAKVFHISKAARSLHRFLDDTQMVASQTMREYKRSSYSDLSGHTRAGTPTRHAKPKQEDVDDAMEAPLETAEAKIQQIGRAHV